MSTAPALLVEPLGDGRYRVSGGAEPHVVTIAPAGPWCDCGDFRCRRELREELTPYRDA